MFKKNPNQYFYRHNEPGEEQWVHDWSNEERELFLQVNQNKHVYYSQDSNKPLQIAKEHGCGDKVGKQNLMSP